MVQYAQMINTREAISELGLEEEVHGQPSDSGIHFLEYESNSNRGGDILVTLGDPSCASLTRGQHQSKNISTAIFPETVAKASNNIMPSAVAKALALSLTKTFGKCYSMDSKQIPLLGQIKDVQVALAKGTPEDVVDLTAGLWEMEFDGSYASAGSSAGVVLISPQGEKIPFLFKLEFKSTNNTAEYEALLLGIEQARKRGIKLLSAKGDSELIVK
ncbi:uncharacterized protein LOC131066053 [Cryptomeria japonica]|uniref:uncharacterized protein LOC131066053 n=1 Tax=Cryptomeria japonica TaxID=3369 RepID=UPI0027DA452F|nr:uncharacterized protein LOC131066053 [Cryptomeria japonica]